MLPPIHRLGYVVEDLHRDVPRFAGATGAGPFFAIAPNEVDARRGVDHLDESLGGTVPPVDIEAFGGVLRHGRTSPAPDTSATGAAG